MKYTTVMLIKEYKKGIKIYSLFSSDLLFIVHYWWKNVKLLYNIFSCVSAWTYKPIKYLDIEHNHLFIIEVWNKKKSCLFVFYKIFSLLIVVHR